MQVWPSESTWKNSNLTSSANTFLSLRILRALRILFCWTHLALQLVQQGVAPSQRQRDGEKKDRTGKRRGWRATGRVICTHQCCWLSRAGNGIQDPESHHWEAARKCCEIPLCPVGSSRFYSFKLSGFSWVHSPPAGIAAGSAPHSGNQVPKWAANIYQPHAQGWVKRPSQAHRAFGRTIQAAELGQPPLPSCIPTALSTSQQTEQAPVGKHPGLTCAPKPILSTSLSCTRGDRGHMTPKPQRGLHTRVVQAAPVRGFPKFWLQEYNPSLCPLDMEIQERENGGCFLSWELSLTDTSFLYRKLMFTTAIHLFWNSVHLL